MKGKIKGLNERSIKGKERRKSEKKTKWRWGHLNPDSEEEKELDLQIKEGRRGNFPGGGNSTHRGWEAERPWSERGSEKPPER